MESNANAELAIRVKALEADVARMERDIRDLKAAIAADLSRRRS
jgi:hypothetical protein